MVKVKFITNGANSAFGGFCAGDELRCSEAMARHLVDDVKCAKYSEVNADIEQQAKPAESKPTKSNKSKVKE